MDPGIGRRADRRRRAGTVGFVVVAGADKKARRSRDRQLVAMSGGQRERGEEYGGFRQASYLYT